MKNFKLALICLCFTLTTMVVTGAEAGWTKKSKKKDRTEKTEEMKKPARYDKYPAMQFVSGILTRGVYSGWKVGETPLYLSRDCVITVAGAEEGFLEEGRKAVVMGSMIGGGISAYSINVSRAGHETMNTGNTTELMEVGPNPNVGRIIEAAE